MPLSPPCFSSPVPREPDFAEVDIPALLAKAGKLLEHDFIQSGVSLHLTNKCPGSITADGDLLLQVLLNLLNNAIQASNGSGTITLSCQCKPDSDSITISIGDTGTGMTREEREKMFAPFFTTRKGGTGLGLAVSHQIIEQHQGHFDIQTRLEDTRGNKSKTARILGIARQTLLNKIKEYNL